MDERLIQQGYIPLDKSWIMRMGVLDLLNGSDHCLHFLELQSDLSDDLLALERALRAWIERDVIDVGESGTLLRFLQFVSWKNNSNKRFIKHGTLETRDIETNPSIITYSQKDLLSIDNKTSQWASAKVLCGDEVRLDDAPYKLQLTYEAIDHWQRQRARGEKWEPRYDKTILAQALTFLALLKNEQITFEVKHSEDYCFARALNFITQEEGARQFPSLEGHESNRLVEMEEALNQADSGALITSRDHRVVQAIAMRQKKFGAHVNFEYPDAVNKTWPQFWWFLKDCVTLQSI